MWISWKQVATGAKQTPKKKSFGKTVPWPENHARQLASRICNSSYRVLLVPALTGQAGLRCTMVTNVGQRSRWIGTVWKHIHRRIQLCIHVLLVEERMNAFCKVRNQQKNVTSRFAKSPEVVSVHVPGSWTKREVVAAIHGATKVYLQRKPWGIFPKCNVKPFILTCTVSNFRLVLHVDPLFQDPWDACCGLTQGCFARMAPRQPWKVAQKHTLCIGCGVVGDGGLTLQEMVFSSTQMCDKNSGKSDLATVKEGESAGLPVYCFLRSTELVNCALCNRTRQLITHMFFAARRFLFSWSLWTRQETSLDLAFFWERLTEAQKLVLLLLLLVLLSLLLLLLLLLLQTNKRA